MEQYKHQLLHPHIVDALAMWRHSVFRLESKLIGKQTLKIYSPSRDIAQFMFPTGLLLRSKSCQSGISFISLSEIIFAEASSNYTVFIMEDGSRNIITKTLKEVQELLEESHFFRVHRQYIVNLNRVKHFDRFEFTLTLDNKLQLPVARTQKEKFLSRFGYL